MVYNKLEHSLQKLISCAPKIKILVIGDLILDQYLSGRIDRISPEAPVPILTYAEENSVLGGAANVAHNLKQMGVQVKLVGTIGLDESGKQLKESLEKIGIENRGVFEDPSRPTSCKTRILAQNRHIMRIDREACHEISPEIERLIREYFHQMLPQVSGIICSDYHKGTLTPSLLREIIESARTLDLPVLIDPKGMDYTRYRNATAITPNLNEVEAATEMKITREEDLRRAAEHLFTITDCNYLLITRSKDGMTLCTRSFSSSQWNPHSSFIHIPTQIQEAFDVTGAGDTAISIFALGFISGCDPLSAAKLANLAAGIVVGKVGTVPISKQELAEKIISQRTPEFEQRKIVSWDELKSVINQFRNQNKRIIFIYGYYTLIRASHIHHIKQIRALGDILVIGLKADLSIKQLDNSKNYQPIIMSQKDRAYILSAIDYIDYVAVLPEKITLKDIKDEIQPYILIPGQDDCSDLFGEIVLKHQQYNQQEVLNVKRPY